MYKFVFSLLLIFLISACGVITSSSETKKLSPPTDGNNTDINGTDDDPGDGDGDGGDGGGGTPDPGSIFDTDNAIYDANACNAAAAYRTASDASYGGDEIGENGAAFFIIDGQGLQIRSEHLESETADLDKTWVTLFYKSFPDSTNLNIQGAAGYKMEGVFYLFYDIAWSDESIGGIDNTLYVQSYKDKKPVCYRLILNSVTGNQIDVQKVYR